jgi:hypothetical protein
MVGGLGASQYLGFLSCLGDITGHGTTVDDGVKWSLRAPRYSVRGVPEKREVRDRGLDRGIGRAVLRCS